MSDYDEELVRDCYLWVLDNTQDAAMNKLHWNRHPAYAGAYVVTDHRGERRAQVWDHGTYWGIRVYQGRRLVRRLESETSSLDHLRDIVGRAVALESQGVAEQ